MSYSGVVKTKAKIVRRVLTKPRRATVTTRQTATAAEVAGLTVNMEWEKPYYVTYVPELDNISTYGNTREQALERTKALVLAYVETSRDLGYRLPLRKARIDLLIADLKG